MLTQQGSSSGIWRIEIVSGPNTGATMHLSDGRHYLGSGNDNDVVLADEAVADRQLVVEITRQQALFMPLAPGASMGSRQLRTGKRRALRNRTDLQLGATGLRFHGPVVGWRQWARKRLPWAAFAAGCLATMSTFPPLRLSAMTPPRIAGLDADRAGPVAGSAPSKAGADHRPGANRLRVAPSKAVEMLRERLVSLSLDHLIELSVTDDTVLATGAVKPVDRDRWVATQAWFDTAVGNQVAILDKVGEARTESAPRLDVRAVSVGAVPFVITGSGDRYAEGSILPNGWTITGITADHVSLRNGQRSLDIKL